MVNYTYAFSQSESGKYFEWIIKVVNNNRWCIQAKKINAFNQSLKTAWFLFMFSLVFTDLQVKSRTPKQSIPFFQFLLRLDSSTGYMVSFYLLYQDYELQNWIKDLYDNGYPVTAGHVDHGVPASFKNLKQLREFLTAIIFTCACQHAAVNFSQLDVYGFPPNSPALMRQPPPTKKGEVAMENLMKCLATKHQASITIATVYDLTRIYPDEVRFTQNCTNM